jgi:hypothetical protein
MEAARISETSVDICLTTRQYIPGDSELNTNIILPFTPADFRLPRALFNFSEHFVRNFHVPRMLHTHSHSH